MAGTGSPIWRPSFASPIIVGRKRSDNAVSSHVALGPEGGNLLGFLASVGTLVTLTRAWPDRNIRMSWEQRGGWRPVWHVNGSSTDEDVIVALARTLKSRAGTPEFSLGD